VVVYSLDEEALHAVADELLKAGIEASLGANGRRGNRQVLLLTDEGAGRLPVVHARTIVNFDIPPDPVLIAHRVDRHMKPGAQGETEVLFLCVEGSFEERFYKSAVEVGGLLELFAGGVEAVLQEAFGDGWPGEFLKRLLLGEVDPLGRALLLAKERIRQSEERFKQFLRNLFGGGSG